MVRYFGGGRRAWGAGGFPRVGDAFVKYDYIRTMQADLFIFYTIFYFGFHDTRPPTPRFAFCASG
jgi:hypothetical protein